MKGGMILSLVTLCVVMLFTANRIERFLFDGQPPSPEPSSSGFDPLLNLWSDIQSFFTGRSAAGVGSDHVVITEDTLYQAWIWTDDAGSLYSSRLDPGNGQARQVLIPRGMTVADFFAPTGGPRQSTPEPAANPGGPDTGPDDELGVPRDLQQMSAEERRRQFNQGMEVLRRRNGAENL